MFLKDVVNKQNLSQEVLKRDEPTDTTHSHRENITGNINNDVYTH